MQILVYGTPECQQCRMTEQYLNQKKISFEKINLHENPDAADMIRAGAIRTLPRVEVREGDSVVQSWHGFQPMKFRDIAVPA